MKQTHAEGRFKALLILWLFLFSTGTVVIGVAIWLPDGIAFFRDDPFFVLAWIGQVLLLLLSLYLFNGLADNELCALVLVWYKIVSGTVMIVLLLSRGTSTGGVWPVIGGGLLDYLMGGATLILWLTAHRSRAVRMPFNRGIGPSVFEEPSGKASARHGQGLMAATIVFSIMSIALLATGLFLFSPQSVTTKIALGNGVAVYAALASLSRISWESPRRRPYAQDIVVIVSLFAAVAYVIWTVQFQPDTPLQFLFLLAGVVHLILAVVLIILSAKASHEQRPSAFFGPWLHGVFERFAEVIIDGDIELVTPREIVDTADKLLAKTTSQRVKALRFAVVTVDLASFLRLRIPMSRMGRRTREKYLTDVFQRGKGPFRDLIRIKQLVYLAYYSDSRVYNELGFVPFQERELFKVAKENELLPRGGVSYPPPFTASTVEADVCVIGSGAGGAVVASRLAEAGKQVVILEEGPFLRRDRINHDELDMTRKSYRDGGLQLTVDFDMYVLQGRCVGGSTFMNNGVCFDLPKKVFQNWQNLGLNLDPDRLAKAFEKVRSEIQIIDLAQRQHMVEKGSHKFMQGGKRLSLSPDWFEVNLDGCIGCGYCTLGCPYEKKMSVDRSYIPRAIKAGAILIPECRAETIKTTGFRANTVQAKRVDGSTLTVQAKQIVVSAGAIGSSLLLLRSGIKHNVGKRLCFNVGSWVFGEFEETIDSFDGIQMSAYIDRPRYFLETIAMSPGAFAAAMPGWFKDHFDKMRLYRHFAVAGALIGTEPVGQVRPSRLPVVGKMMSPVDFTLSAGDLRKLREGIRQVCRVFLAAGAKRVIPTTFYPLELIHQNQLYRLDDYIVENDDIAFGSAHPQGGNAMSDDRSIGAVDSHFRVHGFDNLFVCDASVFPGAVKVNPQLTIMAMADYAAEIIQGM